MFAANADIIKKAEKIEICDPDPHWPHEFELLRAQIASVAPTGAAIDHIGSTSVPNLPAKNIIDIQMSVRSLRDVDVAQMASVGYRVSQTAKVDHCPPGKTVPDDQLQKLFFTNVNRASNLHVREFGKFNQRYALLCRDYLRSHPLAAAAYAEIKRQLALKFPTDWDSYYDIKDPVFDLIMVGAEEWAVGNFSE